MPDHPLDRGPDAGEGRQLPIVVKREPNHVLFLGLQVRLRSTPKLSNGTRERFSGLSQPAAHRSSMRLSAFVVEGLVGYANFGHCLDSLDNISPRGSILNRAECP